MFLNQPISSRSKGKTNVLVCATFIMKKQPFIFEKVVLFGIFIDFLVLEKKNTKMCSFDSCWSSIFRNDQEKQPEKFDCPVHQIKKCKKKDKTLLECVVSNIHRKAHTEKCASKKRESLSLMSISYQIL